MNNGTAPAVETLPRPVSTPRLVAFADAVAACIADAAPLGVALSGGVDSTVLLALAVRGLGRDQVLGIIGVSPSLAQSELSEARALAVALHVRSIEITTYEGEIDGYVKNGPDRCYFCKNELFGRIRSGVMRAHGLRSIAYGETADDVGRSDRAGSRAAAEHGVLTPLVTAGIGKPDVRALAFEMGLPNWDKPAAPCLASRIPHFDEVRPEKLKQIEIVEEILGTIGFKQRRVRHHGDIARIEVAPEDLPRLVQSPVREMVQQAAMRAGFHFVTTDLAGLQPGRLTLLAQEGTTT